MEQRVASALCIVCLALAASPAAAQHQTWIRQFGTGSDDCLMAAVPDGSSGAAYVTGTTRGNLGGTNAGSWDVWLARYDSAGTRSWIRQVGSSGDDQSVAIAFAGSSGIYLAGHTWGSLGAQNAGWQDPWLARYDNYGNLIWIRQFGTSVSDVAYDAAPDATGGVYLAGYTAGSLGGPSVGSNDAWLARYDNAGNRTWIRQFGTSTYDGAAAITADGSGGVYVCGGTSGNLGGASSGNSDAWLARYNSSGTQVWIRQFGTSSDDGASVAAPDGSGGVYVSGNTYGSLGGPNVGGEDSWLARYSSTGNQTWIRHLASSGYDWVERSAPDGSGGVCLVGYTEGDLGGANAGNRDAWMARFDSAGSRTWLGQIGTSAFDYAKGVASDGAGGMYVGGYTASNLGGPSVGGIDAWLARYDATCGTSSSYCTSSTTTSGCVPSISCTGTASASAGSGFTISIGNVEGAQSGLIFYGLSGGVAFPWGTSTSFMCVKSPLERTPVQNSGGTSGACNGVLSLQWNLYIASNPLALGNPFAGGETVRAQGWFRDPPSPKTTNLSNGLLFSVCP